MQEFRQLGGTLCDLRDDINYGNVRILGASVSADIIKVACLGDSNTTGSGLGQDSYPQQLQVKLNTRKEQISLSRRTPADFCVRVFGRSGARAGPGNIQYHEQNVFSKALTWQARIYVVMLGTNDAHQANGQCDKVESSLETLINKINAKVENTQVILVLPPGKNSQRCIQNMEKTVHPSIHSLGKRMKVTVVDPKVNNSKVERGGVDRYLKDDRIHLNKGGASKVARRVSDVIFQIVSVV